MSRSKLNEQVYITGVGCSRFGDLLNTPELKGLNTARDGRLRFDGDRPMSTHGGRQATACPAGNIRYSYPRLRNDWHGGCAGGSLT